MRTASVTAIRGLDIQHTCPFEADDELLEELGGC